MLRNISGGGIAGELEDDAAEHEPEQHEDQRAGDRLMRGHSSLYPGHGRADVAEPVGRCELAADPARQHDDETVADVEELVEVGGNEKDAAAAVARLAQRSARRRRWRRRRGRASAGRR